MADPSNSAEVSLCFNNNEKCTCDVEGSLDCYLYNQRGTKFNVTQRNQSKASTSFEKKGSAKKTLGRGSFISIRSKGFLKHSEKVCFSGQ